MGRSVLDQRFEWMFRGERVKVYSYAEMSMDFTRGSRYHGYVQEILDDLEPPTSTELLIETVDGFPKMPLKVIPVECRTRWWGVLKRHTARNPRPSPFVKDNRRYFTDALTIELRQRDDVGLELVRAYPGPEMPPLPWQSSARGMREASKAYWRRHAFIYRPELVVGTLSAIAPEWFSELPSLTTR